MAEVIPLHEETWLPLEPEESIVFSPAWGLVVLLEGKSPNGKRLGAIFQKFNGGWQKRTKPQIHLDPLRVEDQLARGGLYRGGDFLDNKVTSR